MKFKKDPVAQYLREVLKESGMKQKEFAQATGLSEKHICFLLKSNTRLTLETAMKIEKAFGVSARDLLILDLDYRLQCFRQGIPWDVRCRPKDDDPT